MRVERGGADVLIDRVDEFSGGGNGDLLEGDLAVVLTSLLQGYDVACNNVDRATLVLELAGDDQERLAPDRHPPPLGEVRLDDDIDQPVLILQEQELDAPGRAGPLPADDQAGDLDDAPVRQVSDIGRRHVARGQAAAKQTERVV